MNLRHKPHMHEDSHRHVGRGVQKGETSKAPEGRAWKSGTVVRGLPAAIETLDGDVHSGSVRKELARKEWHGDRSYSS